MRGLLTVVDHHEVLVDSRAVNAVFPEEIIALPFVEIFNLLDKDADDLGLAERQRLYARKGLDEYVIGRVDGLANAVDHVGRRLAAPQLGVVLDVVQHE